MSWLKRENDDIYDPTYTDMLRVAFTSEFKRGRLDDLVALLAGRNFEARAYEEEISKDTFRRLGASVRRFMNETEFKRFTGVLRSGGFVESSMIRSVNAVNFAYILYLLLREKNVPHQEIEELTRRWYVMSVLTGRYTGSTDTIIDQDVREIDARGARASLEQIELSELSDNFWNVSLPGNLISSVQTGSNFKVFLASQVKANDRGFLSRDHTVRDLLPGDSQNHHIFPSSYLKKRGFTQREYNQLANRVILQSEINRAISDTPPEVYFKALREQCSDDGGDFLKPSPTRLYGSITNAEELRENFKQHCIPFRVIEEADGDLKQTYEAFCEKRRKLMALKIRDYYKSLSADDGA